ncbi:MAG: hypothetical protein KJ000_36005 [Pirellulaceae bacterium]|nr:hypothetical protein [Pirellulaceae bacterium]
MNQQLRQAIRENFLVWSGGFPPQSSQEVWVYVETARPFDTDANAVTTLLFDWMDDDCQSTEG